MKWVAIAMGAIVAGVAAAVIFASAVRPEKATAASGPRDTVAGDAAVPEGESE